VALHRVGHMMKGGLSDGSQAGSPGSCQSALHSFKLVAERGDWIGDLARASMLYRQVTCHSSTRHACRTRGHAKHSPNSVFPPNPSLNMFSSSLASMTTGQVAA
jgi:hypothetical protein